MCCGAAVLRAFTLRRSGWCGNLTGLVRSRMVRADEARVPSNPIAIQK